MKSKIIRTRWKTSISQADPLTIPGQILYSWQNIKPYTNNKIASSAHSQDLVLKLWEYNPLFLLLNLPRSFIHKPEFLASKSTISYKSARKREIERGERQWQHAARGMTDNIHICEIERSRYIHSMQVYWASIPCWALSPALWETDRLQPRCSSLLFLKIIQGTVFKLSPGVYHVPSKTIS